MSSLPSTHAELFVKRRLTNPLHQMSRFRNVQRYKTARITYDFVTSRWHLAQLPWVYLIYGPLKISEVQSV